MLMGIQGMETQMLMGLQMLMELQMLMGVQVRLLPVAIDGLRLSGVG